MARPRNADKLVDQKVKDELFRRGVLLFLLHPTQKKMYADIHSTNKKRYVINSSRRLGKTFLLCVIAIEHALRNPGSQIKFAAPTQKMVRKIITPIFKIILKDCPKELRPTFKSIDGDYIFPNDSIISIAGTEMSQIDNLRGQACDLALIDEAGFCNDLEYVLDSVIIPQTLTRPNARIILASTPPLTPDHPFLRYCQTAIENETYSKYTIYDNPMLTSEQIEEYQKEAGGAQSTAWRREYLAEFVTDTELALFPEATDDLMNDIVFEQPRPTHFIPFTALDLGYVDNTGVVFGYYDFAANLIVIEDELLVNKSTSAEIVKLIEEKELTLWGDRRPKARVADAPAIVVADFNETHRFSCFPPDKSDLTANVNRVRMELSNRRLAIHPRCKKLIDQLKFGMWDANKSKFSRSSDKGHWDLCAALIYFCKHLDVKTNPIPADFGWNPYTDWGFPRQHKNPTYETVRRMFFRR